MGFSMSKLFTLAFFLLGLTSTVAYADSTPFTLKCDSGRFFPTGVNATMTERSDLVIFKDWCEKAGTSTLPITMSRNGDVFVFKSKKYGSTRDLPAVASRSRASSTPSLPAVLPRGPASAFPRYDVGAKLRSGSKIDVVVDVSEQAMRVSFDGRRAYQWPVSTARPGKITPRGSYGVQWLSKDHRSSLYDGAPMPFAIFFNGNFAIHGTDKVKQIGTPASAGCVRLLPSDASRLFEAVRVAGRSNVSIRVID